MSGLLVAPNLRALSLLIDFPALFRPDSILISYVINSGFCVT